MFPLRARQALTYCPISKNQLDVVCAMDLDPAQLDEYLGPLPDILATVRAGAAHSLIGITAEGRLIGFYVVHPDPRDAGCWWLGWFILARAQQGRGLGRAILARIMAGLRGVPGCQRIRLIVVPENAGALALYAKAGFRLVATMSGTGDLVLECALRPGSPVADTQSTPEALCPISSRRGRRRLRVRPRTGPHPVRVIGVKRGPPAAGTPLG